MSFVRPNVVCVSFHSFSLVLFMLSPFGHRIDLFGFWLRPYLHWNIAFPINLEEAIM